jgi:hypothetical protein
MRLQNQDPNLCQPRFCNLWIFEAETLQDIDVCVAKLLQTSCRVSNRMNTVSTSHHKTNQVTRPAASALQNLGVKSANLLQTRCKISRQSSNPLQTCCRGLAELLQKTHPRRALTTAMHEWARLHVPCENMACALRNNCKPVAGIQVGQGKVTSKPWHTRCKDQVNQLRKCTDA